MKITDKILAWLFVAICGNSDGEDQIARLAIFIAAILIIILTVIK